MQSGICLKEIENTYDRWETFPLIDILMNASEEDQLSGFQS